MLQGHILKFLKRQQQPQIGRRLFHQQKHGHSKESPDWFKKKFSLQATGGYQYKHDNPQYKKRFKYQSQKSQINVYRPQDKNQVQFDAEKNAVNNRKKGLLSSYLDQNSWMKATIPLLGFQRNQDSRRLNSIDRQKNIDVIQQKKKTYIAGRTASNFYSSKSSSLRLNIQNHSIKTSHQRNKPNSFQNTNPQNDIAAAGKSLQDSVQIRSKSNSLLLGEKQRIRSERLQLVMNKIHAIEKIQFDKHSISNKMRTIDSNFVERRMAMTAREWGGKKISPSQSVERFDEMFGWNEKSEGRSIRGLFNKKLSSPLQVQNISLLFQDNNFFSNQL